MITLALAILYPALLVAGCTYLHRCDKRLETMLLQIGGKVFDTRREMRVVLGELEELKAHVRRLEQREQPRTPSYEATKRAMEGTEN